MLNTIAISGRLVRDIELRHTNSGKSVCSFTLAVDRDFKNANGEKEVDYVDCVSWGNAADFVSRYAEKGRLLIVYGRLQIREWTDNGGNKRRNAEVITSSVYFGDSKRETQRKEQQQKNFDQLSADVGAFAEIDQSDVGSLPF